MLYKYIIDVSGLSIEEVRQLCEKLDRHAFIVGVEEKVNNRTTKLRAFSEYESLFETLLNHPKGFILPEHCKWFKC